MKIFRKISFLVTVSMAVFFLSVSVAKAEDFKWTLCQSPYNQSWECKNTGGVIGNWDCGIVKYDNQDACEVEKNKKSPPLQSAPPPSNSQSSPSYNFKCTCSNNTCSNLKSKEIGAATNECEKDGEQCTVEEGVCVTAVAPVTNPVPLTNGEEIRCVCESPNGKATCIYDLAPKVWTNEIPSDCKAKEDKNHKNCQVEAGSCANYNKTSLILDSLKVEAKQKLNPVGFFTGQKGVIQLMGRLINFLMFPIGGFAMLMYIWAGFLWMSGASDNITKAKSILTWTTLGILFSLSSYMLVQYLFSNLITA